MIDSRGRANDRGSTLLMVPFILVVAALVLASTVGVTRRIVAQRRAQQAADLTALAATEWGTETARRVAAANGSTLESSRVIETAAGSVVQVIVARDGVEASAHATSS